MPLCLFPYGVMKVKSWEWLLSWMVFPGLNASFCLEPLPSSQGWSVSTLLYPYSISCCLSHICMVSLTWGSPVPLFPIVFLYCLSSPPSLPYHNQLAHPALLGRIINPKLNEFLLLFTKEEHTTELSMWEVVWSKPAALLENCFPRVCFVGSPKRISTTLSVVYLESYQPKRSLQIWWKYSQLSSFVRLTNRQIFNIIYVAKSILSLHHQLR